MCALVPAACLVRINVSGLGPFFGSIDYSILGTSFYFFLKKKFTKICMSLCLISRALFFWEFWPRLACFCEYSPLDIFLLVNKKLSSMCFVWDNTTRDVVVITTVLTHYRITTCRLRRIARTNVNPLVFPFEAHCKSFDFQNQVNGHNMKQTLLVCVTMVPQ